MPSIIQTWSTPIDPGGGNPSRHYFSPALPAGWTRLRSQFNYSVNWSGGYGIDTEGALWFNRFPQPPSPFVANDPNQAYITRPGDRQTWVLNNSTSGGQVIIVLSGDLADAQVYCGGGTRAKPGVDTQVYVTDTIISLIASFVSMPWWVFTFIGLSGIILNTGVLCGTLPPQLPTPDENLALAPPDKLLQYFYAFAWPYYCECIPGTPTPTPPPFPVWPQPPGLVTPPAFPCDNLDLCGAIQNIQLQVANINGRLVQFGELVTLLQRYTLPFAYVRGARHSSISGRGSIQISRLLGIGVHIALQAPPPKVLKGNPPYIWNQGWLSISDANGMVVEKRIAQDDFNWLPKDMPLATTLGYDLYDGCVIDVTELQAET